MQYEFKDLTEYLKAVKLDVSKEVKRILKPYEFMFPDTRIIIGVIIKCPNVGCNGETAFVPNGNVKELRCTVCKIRIDVKKYRNRVKYE